MKTTYFIKYSCRKALYILFTFFWAINFNSLCSQSIPFIAEIEYNSTEKFRMAIPSDASQVDIHPYDMPSFEQKEISYKIEKSTDRNGNPTTVQTVTNAVNYHEDWQNLSSRWEFNENGTTIYDKVGSGRDEFYEQRDLIELSEQGQYAYLENKKSIDNFGYLASSVYPKEIKSILDEDKTPYIATPDGQVVTTNGQGEYMVYHLVNNQDKSMGIIKHISYHNDEDSTIEYPVTPDESDPEVSSISISVFDIDICDQLFLSNTTYVQKEVLFNGLCAKSINEISYSNYNFNCPNNFLRSSTNDSEDLGNMRLSPNPLHSNSLTVTLPIIIETQKIQITISALNGQVLGSFKQKVNGDSFQLNLNKVVQVEGLYLISINAKEFNETQKLYITKN